MKFYGLDQVENSVFHNLTLDHNTTFPDNPSLGELFFKTTAPAGLYCYDGTTWVLQGSSGGTGTIASQNADNVSITGGSIINTPIGNGSNLSDGYFNTAPVDTNTSFVATTAFVLGQAGTTNPTMNGALAIVGTSHRFSRQDHVHPSDTTRAPVESPTFTGIPAAPTASPGTNTTQLATTAFVTDAITTATPDTGVVAGTYNNSSLAISPFTVDTKGKITNVAAPITITPSWSSLTAPTASNSATAVANTTQTLQGHFDTSANNAQSLFVLTEDVASTKTGTQVQRPQVLTVTTLSGSTAHPLYVGAQDSTGNGNLIVHNSGSVYLTGGIATSGVSSPIQLTTVATTGSSGSANIALGTGNTSGDTSSVTSGSITVATGSDSAFGNSGNVAIQTGSVTSGTAGSVAISAGGLSTINVTPSGITIQGTFTLAADPTSNLHAATKQYVDNILSNLTIDGGTY